MKPTTPPLEIVKPCSMDWSAMSGDERKRFCAGCGKHVFNLSAMTEGEARKFADETQGRECIAYLPTGDGRIHTPNHFERKLLWLSSRLPRVAAILAILLPAALAAAVERTAGKPAPPKDPPARDGGEKAKPPVKDGKDGKTPVPVPVPGMPRLPEEKPAPDQPIVKGKPLRLGEPAAH